MGIRVNYDEIDNPFLFVVVSAERAEQLQRGALPRVTLKSKKSTTVAMAETLKNRVKYYNENEQETNEGVSNTGANEEAL